MLEQNIIIAGAQFSEGNKPGGGRLSLDESFMVAPYRKFYSESDLTMGLHQATDNILKKPEASSRKDRDEFFVSISGGQSPSMQPPLSSQSAVTIDDGTSHASSHEEHLLMQNLQDRIDQLEHESNESSNDGMSIEPKDVDIDFYTALPPMSISNTAMRSYSFAPRIAKAIGHERRHTHSPEIGSNWKVPSLPEKGLDVTSWETVAKRRRKKSKMRKEEKVRSRTRYVLPKWIPNETGGYDSDDDNEEDSHCLLFTRQQFDEEVIAGVKKAIGVLGKEHQGLNGMNITFLLDDPRAPDAYILEAEGTKEVLDVLKSVTQDFIRIEIERTSLQRLVNDGESLLVDIMWSINSNDYPSKKGLGSVFSAAHNPIGGGTYIKKVYSRSVIYKAVGKRALFGGCALVAVDGSEISSATDLEKIVMQRKAQGVGAGSIVKIKLTLCLPKYADLSEIPDIPKLNLRKKDGDPFDLEENEFARIVQLTKNESYTIKSRLADFKRQQDEEEDDEEDSLSAASADSSSDSISIPKRRVGSSQNQERNKAKRRKKSLKQQTHDLENSSSSSEKPSAKSEKAQPKRTANNGSKGFLEFADKMKPILSLDYKNTKINMQTIASAMWKKHKELFGEDEVCGEKCKCIRFLPGMTGSIIEEYITRQRKKNRTVETAEELEGRTYGICRFFAPKFVPLLEKEYPTENNNELITRLVSIWELHQRSRMYGIKCKEKCCCEEEWDQIFGKGNMAMAKTFVSSRKTISHIPKKKGPTRTQIEGTSELHIPRKKRPLTPTNDAVKQPSKEHKKRKEHKNKKRKASSLISTMASRKELYEVAFDTSMPLGGFFRTERKQCLVYSICPNGQMAKYQSATQTITFGTSVVSVITGETINKVSNHTELEHFYQDAKRARRSLCILFNNSTAKPSNTGKENSWDDLGHWIGTAYLDDDGWAGGAERAQKLQITSLSVGTALEPLNAATQDANSGEISPNSAGLESWTSIVSTIEPAHKIRDPEKKLLVKKSIFFPDEILETGGKTGVSKFMPSGLLTSKRPKRHRTHSKTVAFSISDNREIFFCKNDASNVQKIFSRAEVETTQVDPELSQKEALINVIRNGSCKDMIELLQTQPIEDFDLESVLQHEYSSAGSELQKVKGHAQIDLNAKYRVLNIYINCIHLIERAMSLKRWCTLDIELKHIDLRYENADIESVGGNITVKLLNGNLKEDLGSLPVRKCAHHISYDDGESPLIFSVHNNTKFRFDQREFVITLQRASHEEHVATGEELGMFVMKLDEIEEKFVRVLNGTKIEHVQSLTQNKPKGISSGCATIVASKSKTDTDSIMVKKYEVLKKLKLQLEHIERFNCDPTNPEGVRLTGNIFGMDGKSILHAAILLVDEELVAKIVKLGADPRCCSHLGIGTPLGLAQRNYSRAKEKLQDIEQKAKHVLQTGGQGVDITVHEKRCNQARSLVMMLQEHVMIEPNSIAVDTTPATAAIAIMAATQKEDSCQSDDTQFESRTEAPSSAPLVATSPAPLHSCIDTNRTEDHEPNIEISDAERPDAKNQTPGCTADMPVSSSTPEETIQPIHLPSLGKRDWVISKQKKCKRGSSCVFFMRRTCLYGHDVVEPLPHEEASEFPTSLPPQNDLPTLDSKENRIIFKKMTKCQKLWWTAAYKDNEHNLVIYVRKVPGDGGFVNEDGTVWFQYRDDTVRSLRYTVHFFGSKPPFFGSKPQKYDQRKNNGAEIDDQKKKKKKRSPEHGHRHRKSSFGETHQHDPQYDNYGDRQDRSQPQTDGRQQTHNHRKPSPEHDRRHRKPSSDETHHDNPQFDDYGQSRGQNQPLKDDENQNSEHHRSHGQLKRRRISEETTHRHDPSYDNYKSRQNHSSSKHDEKRSYRDSGQYSYGDSHSDTHRDNYSRDSHRDSSHRSYSSYYE